MKVPRKQEIIKKAYYSTRLSEKQLFCVYRGFLKVKYYCIFNEDYQL